MANIFKIKHGLQDKLSNLPLDHSGELVMAVDTKALYTVLNKKLIPLSSNASITREMALKYVETRVPVLGKYPRANSIIELRKGNIQGVLVGAGWGFTINPNNYRHTAGTVNPLVFQLDLIKKHLYYINIYCGAGKPSDNVSLYLSDRTNITTGATYIALQTVTTGNGAFIIEPNINYPYLVVVPKTTFAADVRFLELSEIVQSNSVDLSINFMAIRFQNSSNLFIGGGNILTNGTNNIGIGLDSLMGVTSGKNNIAIGWETIKASKLTEYNIAIGYQSLRSFNTGNYNVIIGSSAAYSLVKGSKNIAIGGAVINNVSGGRLTEINNSIFIGNNIAGYDAHTGTNIITIGNNVNSQFSNSITLGNSSTTKLYCQVTTISSLSDTRIKENIEKADTDLCVEAVRDLPVTRYKYKDFTGTHLDTHVTGWLADNVEKVFPKSVLKEDKYFPVLDENGNRTYDEDGNERMIRMEDVKQIAMTEALPTLWGTVQRLIEKVEGLENK